MHTNGLVYKHTYSYICTQNKLISTQTHQLRIHVCMYEMISIKAHDFPLRANTCLVFSLGCIQVHSFHFDTGTLAKLFTSYTCACVLTQQYVILLMEVA